MPFTDSRKQPSTRLSRLRARLGKKPEPPTPPHDGRQAGLPLWVTALDVLALGLLALAFWVIVTGGGQLRLTPRFRVSVTSWDRVLVWAAVVLLVRHLAFRAIPLHRRVLGWVRAAGRDEAFAAAWPAFLASRLTVLFVGVIATLVIGFREPAPWRMSNDDVLNLPARFDAGWYLSIATEGYGWDGNPNHESAIAFFPAFPMIARFAAALLGIEVTLAAFLVPLLAFFLALMYFYRLAREDLPAPEAGRALMFLAFYPFAVYFSAPYTESLFLLAATGAFLHLRRAQPVKAASFGLLAGLLRPNGVLLAAPLGLAVLIPYARSRGWLGKARRHEAIVKPLSRVIVELAAASAPALGLLVYCAYIYSLTGDPLAWAKAQAAWGRSTAGLFDVIDARWLMVTERGWYGYAKAYPIEVFEFGASLFALVSVWPVTRRFGLPYGLLVAACVLPPLVTMGPVSLGRYTSVLFPIFLWMGAAIRPERLTHWIAVWAGLQALVAALFFTWRAPF